jgi:hypothetical protein
VIDASHIYQNTIEDIRAVYQLNYLPITAIFHDFSLRHLTLDVNVEKAIYAVLGHDVIMTFIGEQIDDHSPHPKRENPSEDGHYWESPGSEGALIELPLVVKSPQWSLGSWIIQVGRKLPGPLKAPLKVFFGGLLRRSG